MAKRYKTDYFKKLEQLAFICDNNLLIALRTISSEQHADVSKTGTCKDIIREIKSNLSKDYFAPLEREDIFMLCVKLDELCDNSVLLCKLSENIGSFIFSHDIFLLTKYLKNISESICSIFTKLSDYPKHDNLNNYIQSAESLQNEFANRFYSKFRQSENDVNRHIMRIIENCEINCKEIIHLIQYTLIKNS